MFTLIESGNPHLLEPLTCRRSALEIEVAGSTLRGALEQRWSPVAANRDLSVLSDFWPSRALTDMLKETDEPFAVVCDNRKVAWTSDSPDALQIEAEKDSFQILYPWHILAVNEDALSDVAEKIDGCVRERVTIDGTLVLGEGSTILPGVYLEGIVVVGKNCKIGPNCYIRGTTYVADNCHIGQAVEIKNSILMTKVAAGHLSYIGDSIVCPKTNFGAGTIVSNFRHDGKNHRSMVDGVLLDTGRRKFGAIIGDNVHTGIHSSVYPGRKLWPDISLRPGAIVQKDLKDTP